MSSDLMSLHIGDRILEVNGTPVKDQPIENIENLIRYSDTVLQVGPLRVILLHLVCG
jgi:LIM domain kinase 1